MASDSDAAGCRRYRAAQLSGLIGESEIFPKLFEKVFVPEPVHAELRHPMAPRPVRDWAENPPAWPEIRPGPAAADDEPALRALDEGERAALPPARALSADLVLMDDRLGVAVARQQGFAVTGTLGVLDLATARIDRSRRSSHSPQETNFRYLHEIMDAPLAQYGMPDQSCF